MFDTISKDAQYTKRVRRLGEFHPELGPSKATDGQDIDDPLYGNVGGSQEQVSHSMLHAGLSPGAVVPLCRQRTCDIPVHVPHCCT